MLDNIRLDPVLQLMSLEVNVGAQHGLVMLSIKVLLQGVKALVKLMVANGLQSTKAAMQRISQGSTG